MPTLSKRTVDAAQPQARDYFIWDDSLEGFGLRVFPSGRKTYVVQYRNKNGRSRRVAIGKHGSPWTPEKARDRAKELLYSVATGRDPAQERADERRAETMDDLCDLYLEAAEGGEVISRQYRRPKRASTIATDRGRIVRHIKPILGHLKVKDVARADIVRFMQKVNRGETKADIKTKPRGRAIVRGGGGTARRTVGLLGGIFSYAVSIGLRDDNPVRGVERGQDGKRRVLLSAEQYRTLGEALEQAEGLGSREEVAAIRLLALTGCRRGEILGLKWSEGDQGRSCFALADTKTGASVRPVGRPAFEILSGIDRREGCDLVFPSDDSKNPMHNFRREWVRIVNAAGLPALSPHGLRHAFARVAEDLGLSLPTIAALLGHSGRSITEGYIARVDAVLIASADKVAGAIDAMMRGTSAEVIPMPDALPAQARSA